jgi:hypothetical protein
MAIQIDINGIEVQIYEKMYDYVCNANFSHYADEDVDASAFEEDDSESMFPKVLVRKINLYEDVNFLVGTVHDCEFPETIDIDGVEYILVNFGEDEICYLKATAMEEPIYTLIYRIDEKVAGGVYMYVYPFEAHIFETEEEAQAAADVMNA